MANLNLKFLRGLQNSLPTTGTDGYFYLTTDTHRLYTSIDGKVVPVNEGVVTVANLAALTSITDAKAGDFFYCTEENILCVFNGQTFVQINPDTGATSVEVVGNGNAVTAASYDAATRKLTLTKGETFALPADISTAVGELGDYENVKAYVDAKTTGIASDDDLSALAERVTTAEGEIDVLQEASHTHTFVDSDVEDAIAKKHNHTFIDTDVQDAISKKHSHTFVESELNKIVDGDVAKWNAVAADHLTSADKTTLENAIKEAKKAGTDANTNIETYKVTNDARVKAVEDDVAEIVDGTNGILAQAKTYSDNKLAAARTEISTEIDGDVKVVADELAGYKTSNDAALAGVKATAEAAATKEYTDTELAKKVDKVTGKSLVADTEITKLAGVSDGANKVEASTTNGNIKIDGVETVVYTHPEKHAIADVDGLGDALAGFQAKGDYAVEDHKHVKADITDFAHTHIASEITDLDATIKAYDYATKAEAQGYVDAYKETNDQALADEVKAREDGDKAINDKIGAVTEGKTVVEMINEAKSDATYDDTALVARVKAIEDDYLVEADKTELAGLVTAEKERAEGVESGFETRIKTIEDDYLTSADKTELEGKITAEETRAKGVEESLQTQINTIMNNPDAEGAINSINEFTQYVAEHGTIAEGMRTDINKNKEDVAVNAKAIADETTRATGVEEGLAGRIKDLEDNKAGYATTGEVATAKGEAIAAAETKAGELDAALKTELQAEIDSDVKALADGQVKTNTEAIAANAKAITDGDAAVEAKVTALEEKVYTKSEVEALIQASQEWGSF